MSLPPPMIMASEHTCMLLEWLRRNDADFDENIATYLFSKDPDIVAVEEREAVKPGKPDPGDVPETDDTPADASAATLRLTIGSMKEAT